MVSVRIRASVSVRARVVLAAALSFVLLLPAIASAQMTRPRKAAQPALGEKYRLELAAAWWKPNLFGSVSSDRLNLVGSRVDLVDDLGFGEAKFRDLRVTLRPGLKHKLRFQYTPLEYSASATPHRQITFAGHVYDVALPVDSELGWKVWRFGYEWDFLYRPRGFVGALLEARKTELTAALTSLAVTGDIAAKAPLPSIGLVTRAYVLPDLAVHFEISGLKVPPINDKYEGSYSDMELSGTVNVTNNLGFTIGWRRLNTNLRIEQDFGDLRFQGVWFGGAIRY